tara:strand:+ start:71 stop:625 length:555 start_codon:yes stop_codon:yes gene_type:complete
MNINNLNMLEENFDKNPEDITIEYLISYIKPLKEDIEIIHLYYKINKNKELIKELIEQIDNENKSQSHIQLYMNNEYIKIYNLVNEKVNDINKSKELCGIFSKHGTTIILNEDEKASLLLSLALERSSNCSYLYHEDKFCEKLIELRYSIRKNRAYAYNFIELVNKNNIQYENLEYFQYYLENY